MRKQRAPGARSMPRREDTKPESCITHYGGRFVVNISLPGVHGGPAITKDFATMAEAEECVAYFGGLKNQ